jgi:hypothetical protein
MSRNVSILLVVMCAAIAGLLIYSRTKPISRGGGQTGATAVNEAPVVSPKSRGVTLPDPSVVSSGQPTLVTPTPPNNVSQLRTGFVAVPQIPVNPPPDVPDTKPLPVLEKNYLATTNRDDRLDIMMDISDWPGPESVRVLTRLFQAETDNDLKVDLLDSLLGIEGHVEAKLAMLTLGTQKGLPTEVRQAAIDGLIDLDDQRVIPILNGLLNDPDEEIREGAKDALEMMQSQPAVKLK